MRWISMHTYARMLVHLLQYGNYVDGSNAINVRDRPSAISMQKQTKDEQENNVSCDESSLLRLLLVQRGDQKAQFNETRPRRRICS